MKIVAKSSCNEKEIKERINKGFRYIELQLLSDFYFNPNADSYDHVMSPDWDIVHIHMPLTKEKVNPDVELILNDEIHKVIDEACRLSQKCADYYHHDITLVIHARGLTRTLSLIPTMFNEMCQRYKILLEKYPNVVFSIENVTIVSEEGGELEFTENPFDSNNILASWLNEALQTDRFHTTVDICHSMIVKRIMSALMVTNELKCQNKDFGIMWTLYRNKTLIDNIHLNNCLGFGMSSKTHGVSFTTKEDLLLLKQIMFAYDDNDMNCDITLEIFEDDYYNIKHAPDLANKLKDILGNRVEI